MRDHLSSEADNQLSDKPIGRLDYEVDHASALVYEAIGRISREYPEHSISGRALEDLKRMRPHFKEALAALAEIERRRELKVKELSHRRAFKMLLEDTRTRHDNADLM